MHNLSCKNEFYLHENEKSFPYQRLSTYPRFETEAGGTRKWPIEPSPGARVRDSLARRLYRHADWFVAMDFLIFHILMIPDKDAPGSRDRCLPHSPPQCLRVCAEELWGRDCCVPTPGWYGFAHALETGQAVGWYTCANCCYVWYNATRYLLTFTSNGVVQEP